jgi:ATP-dependent RNA helicase SUPV3L1/SUV3
VADLFAPFSQPAAKHLTAPARGLVHELQGGLGNLPRTRLEARIAELGEGDRKRLAALGIRLGRHGVFAVALLRPGALARRALLWGLFQGLEPLPSPPGAGRVMVPVSADRPLDWYPAVGFAPLGSLALRLDVLEKVSASLRKASRQGPFVPPDEIMSWAGLNREQLPGLIAELGWRIGGDGLVRPGRKGR